MRRYIALLGVFAALVAALGCQHIGGKCDCGYNPANYEIHPPTNPHPAVPALKPVPPPPLGGNEE